MAVQINKWLPKKYRWESYEEATVISNAHIKQYDDHHETGPQFAILEDDARKKEKGFYAEMEGARASYHGGSLTVKGYVSDEPGYPQVGTLRRELWIEVPDDARG